MQRNEIALFMARSNNYGGAERRLLRVFNQLLLKKERNVSILVKKIAMDKNGEKNLAAFFGDEKRTFFYNSQILLLLRLIIRKYKWICLFDTNKRNYIMAIVSKLVGTKVLFCSVATGPSNLIFSSERQKRDFFRMICISDHVDCLYPSGVEKLMQEFPNKTFSQTPNSFTDLDEFLPGVKENIIVFASRLIPGKNVELFIDAIDKCKEQLRKNNYRCLICGYGDLAQKANNMVSSYEILDICSFLGYVNMNEILPKAKVFCSLQNITNYPSQSLIEATACGCYSIITDCGESSLMAGDGFSFLVEPDSHSVADAIIECLKKNDTEWMEVTVKARKFAEKNYIIDRSTNYFERIFFE